MPGIVGGLYFLTFIGGVVLVTLWCMKNDQGPDSSGTHGLFAMKDSKAKPPEPRRRAAYDVRREFR